MLEIIVYAPIAQNTEKEIDNIYNSLHYAKAICKLQEITIIMGDLNAKIKEREDKIVINFAQGSRNEHDGR